MSFWLQYVANPPIPDHCEPTTPFLAFLSSHLHTCVPTPLALITTTLGTLSICSWLFAQLPQIFKNYSLKSTSGLSIYFLVEWLLGDVTNLLGAIFTRQASWQVIIATYYVFVDVVLVYQYAWYTKFRPRRRGRIDVIHVDGNDDRDRELLHDILDGVPPGYIPDSDVASQSSTAKLRDQNSLFTTPSYSSSPPPKEHTSSGSSTPQNNRTIRRIQNPPSPIASPRTFLFISLLCVLARAQPLSTSTSTTSPQTTFESTSRTELAGRILSWISTLLYLGSRLPQIYKNLMRRSTSGLSAELFIAAFFGNLFYSTSLLTNPCAWSDFPAYGGGGWAGPEGNDRLEWVSLAAPFFLGAAGVLALDATVGMQFILFGEGEEKIIKDEEGHWQKVSGWMRGWVPSISARNGGSESESESGEREVLLSRNGEAYGSI
ncbi:MAG: hypothetical protein M1824_003612 [Vezdaea acicularis]|nr:MAG: hypothetical protein M1824_003612 [Vezdaea acicularis]